MSGTCKVGPIIVGADQPLAILAGPCVLEDRQINEQIGFTLREICRDLGLAFIFKASFYKANRSSAAAPRGPGVEPGLDELERLRSELSVPVTTDVHEPAHALRAASAVDLLQVPAFLCRQTDLLAACAETGKPVNVKKGQFVAPTEMAQVVDKLRSNGCSQIMLTERGTFFGYHRLVNDFVGLGDLISMGRPVCFDVTHSTQLPGAGDGVSGGRPEHAALLARAAVAAGVPALFFECHPDPSKAICDASTVQPLAAMADLLSDVARIHQALNPHVEKLPSG